MDLNYNVVCTELQDFVKKLFGNVGVHYNFDVRSSTGGYDYSRRFVSIGYKNIVGFVQTGVVHPVDYVSVYKQCFHEYRHYMHYDKMFTGNDNCGLSDSLVRLMAEQAMINDKFVNYGHPRVVSSNYFKLSYEIDAEEYAMKSVQKYLSDKMPMDLLNSCICESVNKRLVKTAVGDYTFWWGELPIYSVDEGIADLHSRKINPEHIVLNDEVDYSQLNEFSIKFMRDTKSLHEYHNLPVSEQNKYLLQYICRNAEGISKYYPVIADEFPDVVSQRVTEQSKRRTSRLSGLKDAFGKITGLYDDVPEVQESVVNKSGRPLPDIDCVDTDGRDGPGLGEW